MTFRSNILVFLWTAVHTGWIGQTRGDKYVFCWYAKSRIALSFLSCSSFVWLTPALHDPHNSEVSQKLIYTLTFAEIGEKTCRHVGEKGNVCLDLKFDISSWNEHLCNLMQLRRYIYSYLKRLSLLQDHKEWPINKYQAHLSQLSPWSKQLFNHHKIITDLHV